MVMICDDVTWFILVHLGRCIWWKRSVNFWEKDEQVQQKSVPILSHLTDFWWSAALPQCHQPETAWGVPNCHPYLPDLPFLRAPPEQTYRKTESCTSATMSRSSKMLQSWRKRSQGTSGSQNWTHTKAFVFLLSIHLNTPSLAGYSSLLLRIARWTKWDFQPPWWMAENNPQMQSETAMTNQWQRHFQHYWGRKHQALEVKVLKRWNAWAGHVAESRAGSETVVCELRLQFCKCKDVISDKFFSRVYVDKSNLWPKCTLLSQNVRNGCTYEQR